MMQKMENMTNNSASKFGVVGVVPSYDAPTFNILDIEVESGFDASGVTAPDFDNENEL